MTDPTADAAKLLPCPFCGQLDGVYSEATGPYTAIARCSNCNAVHCEKNEVEAIAKWNTRPQPAPPDRRIKDPCDDEGCPHYGTPHSHSTPPEGEPDFERMVDDLEHKWVKQYLAGDPLKRDESLVRDAYRLGLAARPKIEDEDVRLAIHYLRDTKAEIVRPAIADLLECLAGERNKAQEDYSALSVRHTDVARNLEAFKRDLKTAQIATEAAEAKLAEREAELARTRDLIWFYVDPMDITPEYKAAYEAARQQQKASAEPTEGEGK